MSTRLDLTDRRQNGAYCVGEADFEALNTTARACGHLVSRIDLAHCAAKDSLLQRIATALAFPDTFGANWDALADCLADLEWLPQANGQVWLFDHAGAFRRASPRDFATLCTILQNACTHWKDRNTPCFAFLALPGVTTTIPVPTIA